MSSTKGRLLNKKKEIYSDLLKIMEEKTNQSNSCNKSNLINGGNIVLLGTIQIDSKNQNGGSNNTGDRQNSLDKLLNKVKTFKNDYKLNVIDACTKI
jgi:hypothetical protein